MNGLAGCVFWTDGQRDEARAGGYSGQAAVVPLGVDLEVYRPMSRRAARTLLQWPEQALDAFVVGWMGRNHPQKRLDLMFRYFAEWQRRTKADAYLFMHIGPTGDIGYDVQQLAEYYRIASRVFWCEPPIDHGVSESQVAATLSAMDVLAVTSQGEGWNLPAMEAMACGTPVLGPNYMAMSEWARDAAFLVPCSTTNALPGNVNCIGAPPDERPFIEALDALYRDDVLRRWHRELGLTLVQRPEYRWPSIGAAFLEALDGFLSPGQSVRMSAEQASAEVM